MSRADSTMRRRSTFLAMESDYLVNPAALERGAFEVFAETEGISVMTQATRKHADKRVKQIDDIPRSESHALVEPGMKKLLGQWLASGICGNNISSSCLYVVALCAQPAGKYAPLALAAICVLLYLFRRIYTEVVSALPVNGGTYNLLLNTTTKGKASVAACLTMLSYVATAVISSSSAMRYAHSLCGECEEFSVVWATVGVLSFVAFLNLIGISESAGVALLIFVFHLTSLTVLIVMCAVKAITDMPDVTFFGADGTNTTLPVLVYNWEHTEPPDGAALGLFFGYASALLGISGFESSANYVEQQKPGVFPKTLRNMWLAVTFINPLTSFLAQCLLTVDNIGAQAESGALLSLMGKVASGRWLEVWIIIDAALVLTGAVLSSFVGFTGLVHRMTMDRCLPQVLLRTNKLRGTKHNIIMSFWTLTSCLVLFTQGNVVIMGGVYTIAFLSVMCLFVVGNALLKLRRSSLPTPLRASWKVVILAFVMMLAGLLGNILSRDALALQAFFIFGAIFVLPVMFMLNRTSIMRVLMQSTQAWSDLYQGDKWRKRPAGAKPLDDTDGEFASDASVGDVSVDVSDDKASAGCMDGCWQRFYGFIKHQIHDRAAGRLDSYQDKPLIYFTSQDSPPELARAIQYLLQNEQRRWIKFVRFYKEHVPEEEPAVYNALRKLYPQLNIDYAAIEGEFTPAQVRRVSYRFKVPTTFMFMASFGSTFEYSYTELGGIRIITADE